MLLLCIEKIIPRQSKHSRQSFHINPNTTNQILVYKSPSRQRYNWGASKPTCFFWQQNTQQLLFLHMHRLPSFSWCFIRLHYSQSIILKLGCWVSASGTSQNAITGLRVSTHCGTSNIMTGYCAIKRALNIMRPAWPRWGLLRMTILFIIYAGIVLGGMMIVYIACNRRKCQMCYIVL